MITSTPLYSGIDAAMALNAATACNPSSPEVHPQMEEQVRFPFNQIEIISTDTIPQLFPVTEESMKKLGEKSKEFIEKAVQNILDLPNEERTFQNTVRKLDDAEAFFNIQKSVIDVLKLVHPEENMRETALHLLIDLKQYYLEKVELNRPLYQALRFYTEHNQDREILSEEQHYHLKETMKYFVRSGMELDSSSFETLKELKKNLTEVSELFQANIDNDKSHYFAAIDELKGVPQDVIDQMEKEGEKVKLTCDYPIYFPVMENCLVEETRMTLCRLFKNRAYPENREVLRKMLDLRTQIAKLIGYDSWAHLDLEGEMVRTPERAQQFIEKLLEGIHDKIGKERQQLITDLPESVTLTEEGKIKQWDLLFIENQYKKKHLNVDESKLKEYFSMDKTIEGLFTIYSKFFNLDFKLVEVPNLWHDSVKTIELKSRENPEKRIGYIHLDLFPREGKFSHACCLSIVPPISRPNGEFAPASAVVITNFPKATAENPSLFTHDDVLTFFHEFGHAIHAVLGRAEMVSSSGYNCKMDFVEMPSQILEKWMWEKDILTLVAEHYQTGQPLPEELIDAKISSKNFSIGFDVALQLVYTNLSLGYHWNYQGDLHQFCKETYEKGCPYLTFDNEGHPEASFGHLSEYAAKYYGYMWSDVFAADVFERIKESEGLLSSIMGKKYVDCIIGRGGGLDPDLYLREFLGREPNDQAFLRSLGETTAKSQ